MNVLDYWKRALFERTTDFAGRSRRMEYWSFALVNVVIAAIFGALIAVAELFWILYVVWILVIIIPSIALSIRRLHDTGRSGWFLLLPIIPLVGSIILLVFLLLDSDRGPNQYGPSEKYPNG